MLNFNSILLFSEKPDVLAAFYEKVFDKKPDMQDSGWTMFVMGAAAISIGLHDKVKGKNPQPERMMFNLETKDVLGEFKRIKEIDGITVIAEPYKMGEEETGHIATFADPDNNYFQLMPPWEDAPKSE